MMVNKFKNNSLPWQSTIPQQMPWMNTYQPSSPGVQFGQIMINNMANPIEQHLLAQQQHQQHPSMSSIPSATTLTMPVTVCPTSLATDGSPCTSGFNMPSYGGECVTSTTQSYTLNLNQNLTTNLQNQPQTTFQPNLNYNPSLERHQTPIAGNHNFYSPCSSLTYLPLNVSSQSTSTIPHQKRTSFELEDDEQMRAEEPPTKQLLSERKLFEQFGSLQLSSKISDKSLEGDSDSSEDEERSQEQQKAVVSTNHGRKEFERYVYLLFKGKKGDFISSGEGSTMDRLAREERDKLSKAVVLWSPPLRDSLQGGSSDSDEDDEFRYSDHRDFLKNNSRRRDGNDSIIITEVIDDGDEACNIDGIQAHNEQPSFSIPDDIMLE